ncbi:MAG: hypothetical protein LBG59_06225 [Candidatus Peribacteria bacterium]|nr:hypothetical protein [Candidatus Peribacteria bacterium]
MLSHTFQENNYTLLAGVKYTSMINGISGSSLASTFQRFNNQYPLGLLYDYNGGIGFVGCQFNGTGRMDEIIGMLNETGVNNFFIFSGDGKPVPMTGYQDALDCSMAKMSLDQLLLFKIQ